VLVGPHTASGAEILADALQTHKRATVIGQPTLGKDSVEGVHELSNGWGLKLSSARLSSASGEPRAGKGVQPTLPVPAAADAAADADAALSVARAWLRERR
jgi:carboxyl-terminal processing protease